MIVGVVGATIGVLMCVCVLWLIVEYDQARCDLSAAEFEREQLATQAAEILQIRRSPAKSAGAGS
jgi:hypothetical protein